MTTHAEAELGRRRSVVSRTRRAHEPICAVTVLCGREILELRAQHLGERSAQFERNSKLSFSVPTFACSLHLARTVIFFRPGRHVFNE